MLNPGETVSADHYQQQLLKPNEAIERKRPLSGQRSRKLILLRDNTRRGKLLADIFRDFLQIQNYT